MDVTDLVHADTIKGSSANWTLQPVRRAFSGATVTSALHEPLVHFLILGALLFLFFNWRGGTSGSSSHRIVIAHAEIEQLAVGFARTWQKPPTEAELKGLIDEYVKDEIATREAVTMGLDRDDVIIRRRLRQKLEFIAEDTAASVPPTDADLRTWMANHPDAFRSDPKVAFRQVYLSPQRHGGSLQPEALTVLAKLRAAGASVSIDHYGDPTMLPSEQPLTPIFDTARSFGDDFAKSLMNAEPGQWVGPVESSFGVHLVLVSEKVPAAQQGLAAIRPEVEREVLLERKKKELQNLYDRLLEKYTVKIEPLPATPATGAAK
jgi:parvulin-like peptidyl-prolyl cis-trans isomerase-like protein